MNGTLIKKGNARILGGRLRATNLISQTKPKRRKLSLLVSEADGEKDVGDGVEPDAES